MLADAPGHNVEAACQVAHAISTHRVSPEFDYYTAVDDLRPEETQGADMIGTVAFNAACYYRYAALDVEQLTGNLDGDSTLAGSAARGFIDAFVRAVPSGKQATFAAHSPPSVLLGVTREYGCWSLANAFLKPVAPTSDHDLVAASAEALDGHWASLTAAYDTPADAKLALLTVGDQPLPTLARHRVGSLKRLPRRSRTVSTLLLRLEGPLQSWGVGSRHGQRDTGLEPSKSGVIGLVCAALGRPRSEPVDDLAALRMAVRVDHPGELRTDYHTAGAGGFRRADDQTERHNVIVSRRVYLCDASFLVGLEGDRQPLQEIDAALARPHWPLFLGRKACVPAAPVRIPDGLSDAPLLQALATQPGPTASRCGRPNELRVVEEIPLAEAAAIVPDQPVGAAFLERTFGPRGIAIRTIPAPRLMYLSRLTLNPRSRIRTPRPRRRLPAPPHDHVGVRPHRRRLLRAGHSACCSGSNRRRRPLPVVLVQSHEEPRWELPQGYLAPGTNAQSKPIGELLDAIAAGRTYRFRLLANPTRKIARFDDDRRTDAPGRACRSPTRRRSTRMDQAQRQPARLPARPASQRSGRCR